MKKKVGILALQGDFDAHAAAVERAGGEPELVREATQLEGLDGLILPGGESTTMLKLMRYEGLFEPLVAFGRRKPMFGTCAGAILMAQRVANPEQESFGLVGLDVERNAYGRQIDSRVVELDPEPDFERRAGPGKLEAVFIRAPIIRNAAAGVQVLARYNGDPVLVEEERHLVATFHPELTADPRVHRLFLERL
jgi:5'-phosphate synthase pdxT subunit